MIKCSYGMMVLKYLWLDMVVVIITTLFWYTTTTRRMDFIKLTQASIKIFQWVRILGFIQFKLTKMEICFWSVFTLNLILSEDIYSMALHGVWVLNHWHIITMLIIFFEYNLSNQIPNLWFTIVVTTKFTSHK